ncbi:D-glycero-beta-D-manno-heptose 1,7-bisphosphate 7-phosphatase [Variovorax terrae]|uniref:D-glycero-beta-D-manno-heptose-1,7-bisphosphate 7-phosphatase n=1 Tax=Variovorax terrae TaxID=2923278 RepID=A0A9X1VW30_9BURK|nr:D-glycero-beta-D-manno-heptose 1,7-bisphosphate 7-phosphatase [Variovorax terrae]MCJ0761723.1 D-glycero-beta-D-manno-heptose 1,7-bisphosphate 7-phosphatase [Variovorax terrae]
MKLIILDRDGTINVDRDDFVKTVDEWVPLPGALEAIAQLNHAGWHVVVASNQSGLGRGLFDVASLNAMQARMHKLLAAAGGRIDAVFYCPHSPDEGCRCRKPLPGLFEQIGERYGIELAGVPTAGDSVRDLQAGAAVGCEPHLVLTGKGAAYRGLPLPGDFPPGTRVHEDLAAFAAFVIAREAPVPPVSPVPAP